jgi:hypothetical protein
MATILHLPERHDRVSRPAPSRARPAGSATGEIVIFPGIRYEYWDAAPVVTDDHNSDGSGNMREGGRKSKRRRG